MNFTYADAPTFIQLLQNLEHQASSSTVQRLEPPLLVLQSGLYDILRLWIQHGTKSPDGNKERSFVPLPQEPNGQNKSMGAHDQIPPDPANSRHRCTITFVGGAFQNSPLRPDQEGPASERSPSSHKRNLRSATFIRQIGRPPRRRPPVDLIGKRTSR
jgi:hypothetical protein